MTTVKKQAASNHRIMDTDSDSDGSSKPGKSYKMISDDDLYRRSSQFRIWSFTNEQLIERKQEVNQKGQNIATQRFEEAFEEIKRARPDQVNKHEAELKADKLLEVVSFEDEQKYLSFYSENIIKTAEFFKMPTQVKASAMSFFKRFYLMHSVMEYHPKSILFTSVFLAAKSENYFISIESFCKALPKTEPKDILDFEFILLKGLQFTLFVHHPFRPLHGFFLDFQAILLHPSPEIRGLTVESLEALYDKSKRWLLQYSVPSDAQFLFTAPQIALAAMYDNNREVTERYLKKKIFKEKTIDSRASTSENTNEASETENGKQHVTPNERYDRLLTTIQECVAIANQRQTVTREESTPIDKKCIFSLNPTKLIEKRLKKLESPARTEASTSTSTPTN